MATRTLYFVLGCSQLPLAVAGSSPTVKEGSCYVETALQLR